MSTDSAVASTILDRPMQNCSGFYRKHFKLPASWKNGVTWVYFEGVYHNSAMWLNGKPLGAHENGYTSFWHRLDTAGARFGDDAENVLAVYANGAPGTGYWYAGGGLTRHQYLVHTPNELFLFPDRTWVHASDIGQITSNGHHPGHGQRAMATLIVEGTITNGASAVGMELVEVWVSTRFATTTNDSALVAEASTGPFAVCSFCGALFTLCGCVGAFGCGVLPRCCALLLCTGAVYHCWSSLLGPLLAHSSVA